MYLFCSLPEGSFTRKFGEGFNKIKSAEGLKGFYKGIGPLWMRQIPYTMVKFSVFERTVTAVYKYILKKPQNQFGKPVQLTVSFASGYFAGVFCAIVSHPFDTIVSKLNQR